MHRLVTLRLIHELSGEEMETVDILADPDDRDHLPTIRRHFLFMAARAADEDLTDPIDRMGWLHDYTLLVLEHDNHGDVLMRFREG